MNLPTLGGVSASDRVDLPTEQIPAAEVPDRERPRLDVLEPIAVPKIVPATQPTDEPAGDRSNGAAAPLTEPLAEPQVAPSPDADSVIGNGDEVTAWSQAEPASVVPAPQPTRVVSRRPRVRKVSRVVRHVDPWSVFKVASIFAVVGYVALLTSGVLLWRVAEATGTIDNVERWFTQFGWETFELNGGEVFQAAWSGGLFAAVGLIGCAVLIATIFNLVSDLVGGIRVTVLEEEVIERPGVNGKRLVVSRTTSGTGPGS
jgi:hypothetical protein